MGRKGQVEEEGEGRREVVGKRDPPRSYLEFLGAAAVGIEEVGGVAPCKGEEGEEEKKNTGGERQRRQG